MQQQPESETWRVLCERAAIEQDSDKLLSLIEQLNDALSEEENRVQRTQGTH